MTGGYKKFVPMLQHRMIGVVSEFSTPATIIKLPN
jgi:hypothetical protein